jgi:hypothetical protein
MKEAAMNNFFSFRRFGLLFAKHTAEHIRTYLMALGVLFGVLLLGGSFIFFVIPGPPDPGLQTACFVILMLISGTLFTSTVYSDYGIKSKAIPTITLPASAFEKFLVGWLYSYPIFLVVYTSVFFLTLSAMGHLGHWPGIKFQVMTLSQPDMPMSFVVYSIMHSIALFGAIFFDKLHFIKTGFTFFISYAVLMIINTVFLKAITGLDIVKVSMPFGFLNFMEGGKFYSISTHGDSNIIVLAIMTAFSAIIWLAAYFRLKEKQV